MSKRMNAYMTDKSVKLEQSWESQMIEYMEN